jgi:iron complex outermembrane receptor protein
VNLDSGESTMINVLPRAILARTGGAFAVAALALLVTLSPLSASLQNQTGSITGRVLDRSGAPVAELLVRLVNLNRTVVTDEAGIFLFEAVPAGTHLVQVRSDEFGQDNERVEVAEGSTAEVTLELRPIFHLDAVVVSAGPLAAQQDELFQSATSLSGQELRARVQPTLGETLEGEPGIRSTYFGPGASRPIIRGLSGDRVRILESGLGSGDAANTSPDHAVALDPASADRIEVVRGPATLLYGSAAIGGVVNVFDGRIPYEAPTSPFTGEILTSGGTAANERQISGDASLLVGPFVARVAGGFRNTDDYAIPGFAELGHDEGEHAAGEHEDEVEGVLENSALETDNYAFGLSWVGSRGHLGASMSGFDSFYGVPGGHAHEEAPGAPAEEEEEEDVSIDLEQRRVDVDGELRFDRGLLDRLRVRFGVADYEHVELEGSEIGTQFLNDQWEGRAELRHRPIGPLEGALGFQIGNRDFEAIGEEAFTPPSESDLFAVFLYEEAQAGPVRIQLGSRVETQTSTNLDTGDDVDFSGLSFSGGLNFQPSDPVSIALSVSRSVKLPTPEELFSNGPHIATRSFELGDATLSEEVGRSADLTFHVHEGPVRVQLTGFVTEFSDYIYPAFTGNVTDGLDEVRYTQADARFTGVEGEASVEVYESGTDHLALELGGDLVRASLTDPDEPLPRIPPFSIRAGVLWEGTHLRGRASVRRVAEQDRVAPFEEPTPGYTMVEAELGYRLYFGGLSHQIVLQGRNLTDEDARSHTSLLKEDAPMPGRDIRLVYRVGF